MEILLTSPEDTNNVRCEIICMFSNNHRLIPVVLNCYKSYRQIQFLGKSIIEALNIYHDISCFNYNTQVFENLFQTTILDSNFYVENPDKFLFMCKIGVPDLFMTQNIIIPSVHKTDFLISKTTMTDFSNPVKVEINNKREETFDFKLNSQKESQRNNSDNIFEYKPLKKKTINEICCHVYTYRTLILSSVPAIEAAKGIDIPKKSLDDYYYCILQAYNAGFDFKNHKRDSFGVLRKFIKSKSVKKRKKKLVIQTKNIVKEDLERILKEI